MPITLKNIYSEYAERFPTRVAQVNFSTARLRPVYNRYAGNFPNRVQGLTDFIGNNYAIGFTPNLNAGSPTQFKLSDSRFFASPSQTISVPNNRPHINYSTGEQIKTFFGNQYSSNRKYSDTINLSTLDGSPLGKYSERNGKKSIIDQYAKFNLRQNSPGNLETLILRGIQREARKRKTPQRWGVGDTGFATVQDRAIADVERLAKFALTQNGIKAGLNRGILELYFNTRPYQKQISVSIKPPFFEVKPPGKDFRVPTALGGYNNKQPQDFIPPIPGLGIIDTGKTNSYQTGARKKVNQYLDNDNLNKIYSADRSEPFNDNNYLANLKDEDLIPIGFDRVDGDKIIFPGTLSNISDTFTPNWGNYQYIGRPDKVYNYQGLDRNISFSFKAYSHKDVELVSMFERLDVLSKMVMPQMNGNNRMTGPLVRLTIGGLYKQLLGFISSLTVTPSTEIPFDLGHNEAGIRVRGALPILADVSVGFTPIYDQIPQDTVGFRSFGDNLLYFDDFDRNLVNPAPARPIPGGSSTPIITDR